MSQKTLLKKHVSSDSLNWITDELGKPIESNIIDFDDLEDLNPE